MQATGTKCKNFTITMDNRMHKTKGPVVIFDGVCNLCNSTILFILRHDKRRVFSFSSLQSNYSKLLMAESELSGFPDSVILCENGEMYACSEAIIRIAEILGGFYGLAVVFRIIPKSIRDALYNFIAGHRYQWFGKRESCMIPDLRLSNRFLP